MALSGFSTSNYITINSALVAAAPLSIAVWFKTTLGGNMVVFNDVSQNNNYFGIYPVGIYARGGGGVTDGVSATTSYTTNTWQHACGVFASTTSRSVYLNGGSKATSTTSVSPVNLTKINIGVYRTTSPVDPFSGSMAEIGIWNAALTDDEVASLADGFTPNQIRPQSLVAYLPLVRNTQDIKGNTWTTVGSLTAVDHPRIYT